ncbi:hypothetical protein, partial [Sphingomonas faeni]|uniref:hypothetical protein n=1 Tax=Sphingomonas faeni TaxID=185950 RepID=UPI0020BD869F
MSQASDTPNELPDALDDDDGKLSIRTIANRLSQRSKGLETASNKAPEDGAQKGTADFPSPAQMHSTDVGPLPGLEPPAEDGEKSTDDPKHQPCYGPLPGT